MKNQTINIGSTLTEQNFRDNLAIYLGSESVTLLNSLDWSDFDVTNKETRSNTFKDMLLNAPEVAEQLDKLEEQIDKARKEQAKKETEQAKAKAKKLEQAKAKATPEQLAMLKELGLI